MTLNPYWRSLSKSDSTEKENFTKYRTKKFIDEVKIFGIWHRMTKINTQWFVHELDRETRSHCTMFISWFISGVVSLLIDSAILSLQASYPLPWVTHNVAAIKANKTKTFSWIMVFLCPNLRWFFDSFGSTLINGCNLF